MPEEYLGGNNWLFSNGYPEWVSIEGRRILKAPTMKPDFVVANGGSGSHERIMDAVIAAGKSQRGREMKTQIIYVKSGTYKENVVINAKLQNLVMIGDGIERTIITGNKNVVQLMKPLLFEVSGNGFIAKNVTFENTAGAVKHQAVALCSKANHSIFYYCSFKGYRDTLYVHSKKQFYRNCDIYSTVDFIFGDASVVFQRCNIYVQKLMEHEMIIIIAHGRTSPKYFSGISIHKCVVMAAPDLKLVQRSIRTYLGRAWQKYSTTVFMKSKLGGLIDPSGWMRWNESDFALDTLYYSEYMNFGPGANTSKRVKWRGYAVKFF